MPCPRLTLVSLLALGSLAPPAFGQPDSSSVAIIRPGGGFLVAGSKSVVPLELVLPDAKKRRIRSAQVRASHGRVLKTKVLDGRRVRFWYQTPQEDALVEFDVAIELRNGDSQAELFQVVVPPFEPPTTQAELSQEVLDVENLSEVQLSASASGSKLRSLSLYSDLARLEELSIIPGPAKWRASASLQLPRLPPDAPSHIQTLAIGTSDWGFSAQRVPLSVRAPVRISVEIPSGTYLMVKGADEAPRPVRAPADGNTVMEGVRIRYGAGVQVFRKKGRRKKEISLVLPDGKVSAGLVAPIPGQNVADGGIGASIIVAVPPSPFGGEVLWPEIVLEGVKLVQEIDLDSNTKALVIERPKEAKTIRVLLDDTPAGTISFHGGWGQKLELRPIPKQRGERAAAEVFVRDSLGLLTSTPAPKARFGRGQEATITRLGVGHYRAAVPSGTPGEPGSQVDLKAQLASAPLVAGEAIELAQKSVKLTLRGPPPALRGQQGPDPEKPEGPSGPGLKFGLAASASGGSNFGSLFLGGVGAKAQLLFPWLDQRLGAQLGVEYQYGVGSCTVRFDTGFVYAENTVSSFLFPVELSFFALKSESLLLSLRAGAALRVEQSQVTVAKDNAGGADRVAFGARVGVDGHIPMGKGALFLGVTLDGIGTDAIGLSAPGSQLQGDLLALRGEIGYRAWLAF